jgi:Ni,Fe-hydrogenase III component G
METIKTTKTISALKSELKRMHLINLGKDKVEFKRERIVNTFLKDHEALKTENEALKTQVQQMKESISDLQRWLFRARKDEKEQRDRVGQLVRQVAVMGIHIGELEEEIFIDPQPVNTDRYMEEE